ncbi:DUF2130 domain-containing protein [Rhizobium ruizarguesonis]|uniref:DUF2130 domain-containing protein n=1 Tax=Rhizobium ruizarguesonis TaxID=2081791 RepID=UPI0013EE7EF9|nr:DUF2130 domain-containing protein [Rhizobium ruizarguesonis]
MAATASAVRKSISGLSSPSFLHGTEEVCPLCEQQIPHDQFDEIQARIETRQRKTTDEITARLQQQYAADKAVALEKAAKDADEKAALARADAEAIAQKKIEAAEAAGRAALEGLKNQVAEATAAKASAEELQSAVQAQLVQAKIDNAAAIELVKQDAAAQEGIIRAEAKAAAEAATKDRLETAETLKTKAEVASKVLAEQLQKAAADTDAKIAALNEAAALREAAIKVEAVTAAKATVQQKLTETEAARVAAEIKAAETEKQLAEVKEAEEVRTNARLQEQREALEQAQVAAVNAEKANAFKESQKLSEKVAELTRALDKKTNEELGEGAEVDLFESLKAEFENDKIERINKGQPGADILHTVMHNGKACGTIIYDSKNHNAWRNDFVTKLASDQMAAKAEHAILSTSKFPAGVRQLHVQDGVLIANPARVVALISVVRQHIVQTHTLRMSGEEKTHKTAALYSFITSERCADLFKRIDTHAEDLLDLQIREKKAHETTWKQQGELIRSVQKVRGELTRQIDDIIGTGEAVGGAE